MTRYPPLATDETKALGSGVIVRGGDTSKLVVAYTRFRKPSLTVPGSNLAFTWPGGVEGIHVFGAPSIAEHRYLGDNKLLVQVTHRDARRIEMTGQFAGVTAAHNIQQLLDVLVAIQPTKGKLLSVPGVFINKKRVVVETYDFQHDEEDRSDSFTYTIQFIDQGPGGKIPTVKTIVDRISLNPVPGKIADRGSTQRVFTTHSGANTLRAVAAIVYGNSDRWKDIYNKNVKLLQSLEVPLATLAIKTLPYGLKLSY